MKESNIDIPPNVIIAPTPGASLAPEDYQQLNGPVLFSIRPDYFDKRISEEQRYKSITRKQWQEYIDELKCVKCGTPGGKCNCKP